MVLILRDLMIGVNRSQVFCTAYLFVISKTGIKINTTPVYPKYKIFLSIRYLIITSFLLLIIELCIDIFVDIYFWIDDFLMSFINISQRFPVLSFSDSKRTRAMINTLSCMSTAVTNIQVMFGSRFLCKISPKSKVRVI